MKVNNGASFDSLKWTAIILLAVAALWANYHFIEQPLSIRLIGWLVLVCVLLAIASLTAKGKQGWAFILDAKAEMLKVVWPTRKETIQTTIAVIAMVTIMSLILWAVDSFLLWAISLLQVK
jgi:preprotein translocase subunit SecE